MNLVDANVLLYASNTDAPQHEVSLRWLDHALNGSEPVGFAWIVLTAFVRISTKQGLFPHPLSVAEAMEQVQAWVDAPGAQILEPTRRHASLLGQLLAATGTGGNLVSDAHLAAIALEHGAGVVSFDTDFSRFPGLRWFHPGQLA